MKVLHLLDSVNRGGAETIALDVCRNAGKYGIDLTVAVSGSGTLEDDFRRSGADFIRLKRKLPVDPFLVLKLRRIIKKRRIGIVQGYQAVEALHLYLATIGLPVKRVFSLQGFIPGRKNRLAARFLIPRMDANIAVSRGLEKWLKEEFDLRETENFRLIYNCTDPQRLKPGGRSVKAELGLGENARLIGMVANFTPDQTKDQLTVCRAAPEVLAHFEEAHFVFAGRIAEGGGEAKIGECREFCVREGIAGRVHFLGARDDVPDILASLDVFVFSSLYEGLPIAVTEAMLAGVPLVLSDIEPLLEVSDGGNCAEIFPVKNAGALSGKIIKLLEDEDLRKDLAARAHRFAAENFSIEAHIRKLKKLYRTLLEN